MKASAQILLDHVFKHIPQFIFWKDIHSVYLGCNQHFADLLGWASPEMIVGRTDLELGWQSDGHSAEFFRRGDRETLAGKPTKNQEECLSVKKGNKRILVLVSKVPLLSEAGDVIGVLGVATDITEKKHTEEKLEQAYCELEAMTRVSAHIAHELRTPFGTIIAGTEGAAQHLDTLLQAYDKAEAAGLVERPISPTYRKLLGELMGNLCLEAQHANFIVDLLLTNLKADSISPDHFQSCSLKDCVVKAIERYPFALEERAKVHWDTSQEDCLIWGNGELIIHIIFNLLKNALYFIQRTEGAAIHLWVEERCLHFKDTGEGISEEIRPYIFDSLFTQETHRGTGLGLSFCKMVMEAHGGSISCQSKQGVFTEFILQFPPIGPNQTEAIDV